MGACTPKCCLRLLTSGSGCMSKQQVVHPLPVKGQQAVVPVGSGQRGRLGGVCLRAGGPLALSQLQWQQLQ